MSRWNQRASIVLTSALLMALAGCGSATPAGSSATPAAKEVGFVVLQPQDLPVITELSGRANAYRSSEVRPQISGVIRRQLFTEGSSVRAGQPLYEIDPLPYRAANAEAEANLSSALANAEAARAMADRYKPLAAIEAVSQQDYTNAVAAARQAEAAVAQRRAARETARINLAFTSVPAPISGRIGRSSVTVGALVTMNQAAPLALINQLDPIYIDIQQSAADLLALRRQLASGGVAASAADVRLQLEDGSAYERTGHVKFAETLVDPATGTVTLRAEVANPEGWILPGMFVRAKFSQAMDVAAFLVPQQAVTRDNKGAAQLFVVGNDNKAELRSIRAPRTQDGYWVVTQGLKAGDRVIIEGLGNLRAGQAVKPVVSKVGSSGEQPPALGAPSAAAPSRPAPPKSGT